MSIQEGSPIPTRTFHISPKTPHEVLAAGLGSRGQITNDIVKNVIELISEVDWDILLPYIKHKDAFGNKCSGKSAIANSIAVPISSIAMHMGWAMHSPEVVYVSSFHPLEFLNQRLEILQDLLESADKREFMSPEKKETQLEKERVEVKLLTPVWKNLKGSIEEFSRQYLPDNSTYLRILEALPYLSKSMRHRTKVEIFDLLKQGKITEAARILGIER